MTSATICLKQKIHAPDFEMSDQVQDYWTSNLQLDGSTVDVVLPDLFRLFLSNPPRANSHYELVKKESEAWFVE